MERTYLGNNPDGSPHFHYEGEHLVITGKAYGTVTTSDGTEYDISPDVIEVASPAHAGEVSHLIGLKHEQDGHPDHPAAEPFVHTCGDECGALRREG